jgi:hypothetical protein
MPRIRTIKPEHWNDKELPKIPLQAHLLWIATWNFSDDEGIFENDPILIKSQIFPRRTDVRVEQVSQWLDQLAKARFIVPFEYENQGYYIHRTFKTHQKIDKPQKSKIPSEVIRRVFDECSTNVQSCIVEESNSKGKESNAASPPPSEIIYPFETEIFKEQWNQWKNYKKVELKFNFKSPQSEQAALADLVKKADGIEETAIAIIHQSMANGWKGFFELKNSNNGNSKTGKQTGTNVSSKSALSKLDRMPD